MQTEFRSLYEITGKITDHNMLVVPAAKLKALTLYEKLAEEYGLSIFPDLEALAAEIAPQQEPVAWQSRMRPTWGSNTVQWSPWENCTKGQAEDYWKTPVLNEWAYEARALYTEPQPSPAAQEGK